MSANYPKRRWSKTSSVGSNIHANITETAAAIVILTCGAFYLCILSTSFLYIHSGQLDKSKITHIFFIPASIISFFICFIKYIIEIRRELKESLMLWTYFTLYCLGIIGLFIFQVHVIIVRTLLKRYHILYSYFHPYK
eukprot:103878_1